MDCLNYGETSQKQDGGPCLLTAAFDHWEWVQHLDVNRECKSEMYKKKEQPGKERNRKIFKECLLNF